VKAHLTTDELHSICIELVECCYGRQLSWASIVVKRLNFQ